MPASRGLDDSPTQRHGSQHHDKPGNFRNIVSDEHSGLEARFNEDDGRTDNTQQSVASACTRYRISSCVVLLPPTKQLGNVLLVSVCMSVCLSVHNTKTVESLDVERSFFVCGDIFRGYGSRSYMKVIGSGSRSQGHNIIRASALD